jgi:hypothetical protein
MVDNPATATADTDKCWLVDGIALGELADLGMRGRGASSNAHELDCLDGCVRFTTLTALMNLTDNYKSSQREIPPSFLARPWKE